MDIESIEAFFKTSVYGQIIIGALGSGIIVIIENIVKSIRKTGKRSNGFGGNRKMFVEMMVLNPKFLEYSKFMATIKIIVAIGVYIVSMLERNSFYFTLFISVSSFYLLYGAILETHSCHIAMLRLVGIYNDENKEKFVGTMLDDLSELNDKERTDLETHRKESDS
ncbi:hypothetical protein FGM00_00675 [Aggregatimonas sangjinii]|uniref:DUF2721 domain-containing protein n=1 Tax=Aggregatimonas sangjinii TaxID=2583587 RepID=A0A5B7SNV9_9FLAO|nr:hypothetical protein [Aggregatimonas sangjinii]QCW98707.1 hypothetical protein FGM00_00675 [Aggregatimonas sangjinii]